MNEKRMLYSDCIRIYEVEETFIDSLGELGLVRLSGMATTGSWNMTSWNCWNSLSVGITIWILMWKESRRCIIC